MQVICSFSAETEEDDGCDKMSFFFLRSGVGAGEGGGEWRQMPSQLWDRGDVPHNSDRKIYCS